MTGEVSEVGKASPEEIARLRRAIERINELNRSFDEDGRWVGKDGAERFGWRWRTPTRSGVKRLPRYMGRESRHKKI